MTDKTVRVAADVPATIAEDINELAKRGERSQAAEIRLALRSWVAQQAREDTPEIAA